MVSDCPFQTAGSSVCLRRMWSKDRKSYSHQLSSRIFSMRSACISQQPYLCSEFTDQTPRQITSYSQRSIHSEEAVFPLPPGLSLTLGSLTLFVRSLLIPCGRNPIQIKHTKNKAGEELFVPETGNSRHDLAPVHGMCVEGDRPRNWPQTSKRMPEWF